MGCCQTSSKLPERFSFAGTWDAKVINIIDGDTFDACFVFYGTEWIFRVRIAGVDTPEMHPKRKGLTLDEIKEIKINAKKAKDALETYIGGKRVKLIVNAPEKFGRVLAHVYYNNKDVADFLIINKYGVAYDGKKKSLKG